MSHRIMPMKATVVATYEGYKSYSEYLSDTSFNGSSVSNDQYDGCNINMDPPASNVQNTLRTALRTIQMLEKELHCGTQHVLRDVSNSSSVSQEVKENLEKLSRKSLKRNLTDDLINP